MSKSKTRDHLLVKVINGATKGGFHRDHKREEDALRARTRVIVQYCEQCSLLLEEEETDGFCSDQCREEYFDEQDSIAH